MYSTRYSCQISMELEFSRQVLGEKELKIQNFIKIRLVGADGRTDMVKLIAALRNFANATKRR